jgi:hypothetical protein
VSSPDDVSLDRWRADTRAEEGPALLALGRAALEAAPDARALRRLSTAGALAQLQPAARPRAVALARWGLAADRPDAIRWDAVHVAAELGLTEVTSDLRGLLAASGAGPEVRGRAAEAFASLVPDDEARARLEPVRVADPDWTVRRLAGDALRAVEARRNPAAPAADPFARFRALVRCGRARVEGGSAPLTVAQVAALGLRLPTAYRLFLATACAGGRVVLDGGAGSLTLSPPAALRTELEARGPKPDELRRIHEYVWARYVEDEKKVALDEDWALRLLGDRYDRGLLDADLWNYGVLLYEAAFRDPERRARHLLRALAVLEDYREVEREAWDVVDDRLDDARTIVRDEGLRPGADHPAAPLVLARWEGVHPLAVDLDRPGVFQLDPDRLTPVATLAGTLLELLNDPLGHAPGAAAPVEVGAGSSAAPAAPATDDDLAEVAQHLAQGRHRQAGRAFADALEAGQQAGVMPALLERAAALLSAPTLTPLLSAQLLASLLMAGDKKTTELARDVLQALAPARAKELIDAIAPMDEDGSQYALLTDAAAGLRKKSHTEVRDVAKLRKASRQKTHVRTAKNPFYK